MQNWYQRVVKSVLESLAGGSRSRVPLFERRDADAPAAALLTGLATRELLRLRVR
jgi:hypothetical protein